MPSPASAQPETDSPGSSLSSGERWLRRGLWALLPTLSLGGLLLAEETPTPGESAAEAAVSSSPADSSESPASTADTTATTNPPTARERRRSERTKSKQRSRRAKRSKRRSKVGASQARHVAAVDMSAVVTPRPTEGPSRPKPSSRGLARSGSVAVDGAPPCGDVQVRLITLSDDPEFSTASIAESARDKAKLRRVGDQVGPFRVKTMDWDRVWFDGPGGRCAVGMHPGSQRVAQGEDSKRPGFELTFVDPKPAKKPTLLDAGEQPSWWLPHALARGIDRRGPTELRLSRTAVDGIYDQAEELLEHVTLQALGTPEAPGGLRIEEVRTDSLLDHLGLETGDVLLALDGQASSTRDALISMLRESRANDQLVAKLQRGGDTLEIEVRVR